MTALPTTLPTESPFALLDELLEKGVISKAEHGEQCHRLAFEMVRQHRTQMRREQATAHLTAKPTSFTPEPQMNTQDLLATMQLNNKIMSEQLKSLNSMGASPPAFRPSKSDSAETTADLLNDLTNGHLQSAAQSMQALAGAEARARSEWAQAQTAHAQAAPRSQAQRHGEVIDVEVVEVAAKNAPAQQHPTPPDQCGISASD